MIRKNYLKVVLFILSAGIIFSCAREASKDVNQEAIRQDYTVSYKAVTNVTTIKASFKFGEGFGRTRLKLSDPSAVTFNGKSMDFNQIAANYRKKENGFIDTVQYTWKDVNGNVYKNAISMPKTHLVPVKTIDASKPGALKWKGSDLRTGEEICVTIKSNPADTAQDIESYEFCSAWDSKNPKQVSLGTDKLKNIPKGEIKITLKRTLRKPLNEDTPKQKGLPMRFSYWDEPIMARLK